MTSNLEILRVEKSQEASYLEEIQNKGFEHLGEPLQIEYNRDINQIRISIQAQAMQLGATTVTEVENPPAQAGQPPMLVYYIWRAPQAQAEPQPFACPYCTRPFMALPGAQTQVVACPTCGGANIIPAMEPSAAPAPPTPPPAAPPAAPPATPPPAITEALAAPAPPAALEPTPPTPPPATTEAPAALAPPAAPEPTPLTPPPATTEAPAAPEPTPPIPPAAPAPAAAPPATTTAPTMPAAQPQAPAPAAPTAPPAAPAAPPAAPAAPSTTTVAPNTQPTEPEYTEESNYDPYSDDYRAQMPSFDYFSKKVEATEKKPQAPLIPPEYEASYSQQFTSTEQAIKSNMQKLADLLANPKSDIKFYDSGELMYPKVTIRKSAYTHLDTRDMDLIMIKDGVNDYKIIANESHGAAGGNLMPMQDELFAIKTLGHASFRTMEDWAYLDELQKESISKCIYAFTEIYVNKLPKEVEEEGI